MTYVFRRAAFLNKKLGASLHWSLSNPCFLPQTLIVLRGFRQDISTQFKVALSRLDKSNFKDYTDKEWRTRLSPEQYHVCREKGTEPPWSGEFLNSKDPGKYSCVCCNADLFDSCTKYDSQSGWPSFWAAIEHEQTEEQKALGIPNLSVEQQVDYSYGMVRVEVQCKECGSHLGHVFRDGPQPSGLRYCINSIALKFTSNTMEK